LREYKISKREQESRWVYYEVIGWDSVLRLAAWEAVPSMQQQQNVFSPSKMRGIRTPNRAGPAEQRIT
jgi:hypothetical protein